MLGYVQDIKDSVWRGLENTLKQHSQFKQTIRPCDLQPLLTQLTKNTGPQQRDFLLKNLFKLDSDNHGSIDSSQLGNFLIKRRCGELALQKLRSQGIQDRRLSRTDFLQLLQCAFSSLSVPLRQQSIDSIFNQLDSDRDGFISCRQYLRFLQDHIMKPRPSRKISYKPSEKEVRSRLRRFIWAEVRRIFERLMKVRMAKQLDFKEVEEVIREVMREQSDTDVSYVLAQVLNVDLTVCPALSFEPFAKFFITHAAQLGLIKFLSHHPQKRTLTRQEFVNVFREGFGMIQSYKVSNRLLWRFFEVLDTNTDGVITLQEYLNWIRGFLAAEIYQALDYYIQSDDQQLSNGSDMIIKSSSYLKVKSYQHLYHFSNLSLARRARSRCLQLIQNFDSNSNRNLQQSQLQQILKSLMKSDQFDIFYVVNNIFRYDQDEDGLVDFDEMTDFFLETHNGELALQRLHRKQSFERGDQRLLSLKEFGSVMEYGLSFVEVVPMKEEIEQLFGEIDLDRDGWISYKQYFEFLISYFGSKSEAKIEHKREEKRRQAAVVKRELAKEMSPKGWIIPERIENPELVSKRRISLPSRPEGLGHHRRSTMDDMACDQKVARMIISDLRFALKNHHGFQNLDNAHLTKLLKQVFNLSDKQADYILRNIFRYQVTRSGGQSQSQAAQHFLQIYLTQTLLMRAQNTNLLSRSKDRLITKSQFLSMMKDGLKWMNLHPSKQLLQEVFTLLDEDSDGMITYREYVMFIRTRFNSAMRADTAIDWNFLEQRQEKKEAAKDAPLYKGLWTDLKGLYDHYVKGQYLEESQLEALVRDVLRENSPKELCYIFWNMFRVDPKRTRKVDQSRIRKIQFKDFAPFILKHAGQIALQRFHYQQSLGKSLLNINEFKHVFREAYHFVHAIDKNDEILDWIFNNTLDKNKDGFISYQEYITWIVTYVSREYSQRA